MLARFGKSKERRSDCKQVVLSAGGEDAVSLTDKRSRNIECQMLPADGKPDRWMLVKSRAKAAKEHSMTQQACQRFEAGLWAV